MPTNRAPSAALLADRAEAAGLHRIHILAWRDLADPEAGGSEVHAAEVASRWAAAGIEVVMRTARADGHASEETRDGYRVVRGGGRHTVFLDAPVQELLGRHGRPDGLVEVWNGIPFFTPLWARMPRIAFIHHVHEDMWANSVSPRLAPVGRNIEVRIAPRLYRRTRIVTPSRSSRQDIIERLHLPGDNIRAVPNGVDVRYAPGGRRAERPTVLTVGRLVPHKRVDRVIDAVATVRADVPDVELVIAGDGYVRADLERHVALTGARDWVRFAGRVDDDELVDLYRRAWVLTSASTAEGWGLTLSEAAATGTAVVATRIPGHRDVVAHDESGLLVEENELADGLRLVLTDHERRCRYERSALARAQSFTWDATAAGVLGALAEEAERLRRG